MKTLNDGSLSDFTPWQWELAFIASRFRLGLLSDNEIIASTHKLMDNGFYDDVMLDIIDDDPVFDYGNQFNPIKTLFENLWLTLSFPCLNHNQAKYLFTFSIIYSFTVRPFNICTYRTDEINYPLIAEYAETLIDYHELRNAYFARELPLNEIDWQNKLTYFVSFDEMVIANTNFFLTCENWLTRNQSHILAIMYQLFPK